MSSGTSVSCTYVIVEETNIIGYEDALPLGKLCLFSGGMFAVFSASECQRERKTDKNLQIDHIWTHELLYALLAFMYLLDSR